MTVKNEIKLKQINFGQKIIKFIKTEPWLIIASLIAIATWSVEKITWEEHNEIMRDYYRMESLTNQTLFGIRIFEIQLNETIDSKPTYGIDSNGFKNAFFINVKNKIRQENLTWLYLEVLVNEGVDDNDHSIAWAVRDEKFRRDKEFQIVLNTNDFNKVYSYDDSLTKAFSKEVISLQNSGQETLNNLNDKSRQKRNLYILLYLLAAVFFTIDRINKTK